MGHFMEVKNMNHYEEVIRPEFVRFPFDEGERRIEKIDNPEANKHIKSFLKELFGEKEVSFEIENATKITCENIGSYYNIWFNAKGNKSDMEKIYATDCVYLRDDLRNREGNNYNVKFGCYFENEQFDQYFTHYDRDDNAWKLYQSIYGEKINRKEKQEYGKLKIEAGKEIVVSGDCCFNFNIKKYKYFEDTILKGKIDEDTKNKIIKLGLNEADYRKYLLKKLQFCKTFHHSPNNIALMPAIGKMNNKKQQIANDRLDSFWWILDMHYAGSDAIILSGDDRVFVDNRTELRESLSVFQNMRNYCEVFYNITDNEYIEKMVASGKKAINTPMRVHEYMNLAYEFWEKRELFFTKGKGKLSDVYFANMSRNMFLEYSVFYNETYEQIIG